jgi:hypothetical protein
MLEDRWDPRGSGPSNWKLRYSNPSLDAGQVDSSGVRFYYTSKKRQYDMGIFETGDPLVTLRDTTVSTNAGLSSHTFECRSGCSSTFLNESVTVLGEVVTHAQVWREHVELSD